jgi:hypothetical protein
MTREELDALAAVVAQMTKGPLRTEYSETGGYDCMTAAWHVYANVHNHILFDFDEATYGAGNPWNEGYVPSAQAASDASGIVALVNAFPALLALAAQGLDAQGRVCGTCAREAAYCQIFNILCGERSFTPTVRLVCGAWQAREGTR